AERQHRTISELTREAIELRYGSSPRRLVAAKAGRGGQRGVARKMEQILRVELGASRSSSIRARFTHTSTKTRSITRRVSSCSPRTPALSLCRSWSSLKSRISSRHDLV